MNDHLLLVECHIDAAIFRHVYSSLRTGWTSGRERVLLEARSNTAYVMAVAIPLSCLNVSPYFVGSKYCYVWVLIDIV